MNIYGYSKKVVTQHNLHELSEVTFAMSYAELKKVVAFLEAAAKEKESNPTQFSHQHIGETIRDWPDDAPDIIVS